jgi:hypothetical protein
MMVISLQNRFSELESIPIVNKFGIGLYSLGSTRCYLYFWSCYAAPKYYHGDLRTVVSFEEWFEKLDEASQVFVIFNLDLFR